MFWSCGRSAFDLRGKIAMRPARMPLGACKCAERGTTMTGGKARAALRLKAAVGLTGVKEGPWLLQAINAARIVQATNRRNFKASLLRRRDLRPPVFQPPSEGI